MTDARLRKITPRYASLPLISLLLKLSGFLLVGFAVALFLFGVVVMVSRGSAAALGLFVGILAGGLVLALVLIALAELIHVFLDIEEHTRRAADLAQGTSTGTTPRAEVAAE